MCWNVLTSCVRDQPGLRVKSGVGSAPRAASTGGAEQLNALKQRKSRLTGAGVSRLTRGASCAPASWH